jgi:pre-rRNA-processing protein TSR1
MRYRYARYRALKSFRKSRWDPKENLPDTYGAVYHFASFKATQRDVLEDARGLEDVIRRRGWGVGVVAAGDNADADDVMEREDDPDEEEEEEEEAALARACVPPGSYVTMTLEGVSPGAFARLSPRTLLAAVSLLPHETKVSVLHMGLSATSSKFERPGDDTTSAPVKSKDVLTFRCGWRTWQSRPVFSQHNLNSDKHKFERYMPSGGNGAAYFAGTVFGPVTYSPCPVLMFREAADGGGGGDGAGGGRRELLAHGSMLGADADRIVLKRIVLTGYPTRVHKRHDTVKYMFYNPEDVKVSVWQ